MNKYEKRNEVVEAIQYTGNNHQEIIDNYVGKDGRFDSFEHKLIVQCVTYENVEKLIRISHRHPVEISKGDYLVKEGKYFRGYTEDGFNHKYKTID